MDLSDLLVTVAIVLGVLVLVAAAVIGFVMWRFRVPPRGVVAMFAALAYLASPVDVLPELVLGPLGLVDDAGVVTGAALLVYRLVRARDIARRGWSRPGGPGGRGGQAGQAGPGGQEDRREGQPPSTRSR